MTKFLHLTAFFVILTFVNSTSIRAQSRAIGTAYSFSGISLVYDHEVNNGCFIELALKGEMGEVLAGRSCIPGISASFTWNYILKEWKISDDETLEMFAGPGVSMGYAKDLKRDKGFDFGLKGQFGIEFLFERKAIISLSISPVMGSHVEFNGNAINIRSYNYGLLNSIMPEIGIKYRF